MIIEILLSQILLFPRKTHEAVYLLNSLRFNNFTLPMKYVRYLYKPQII